MASTEKVAVTGEKLDKDAPKAERITNETPIPAGDVTGFRVGSEASQEGSDMTPVKAPTGDFSAATEVKNTELKRRDEEEFRRRGGGPRSFSASSTFEGPMMIDNGLQDPFVVSGSYSGPVGENGLHIRKLTPEEEQEYTAGGARLNRRAEDEQTGGVRTSRGISDPNAMRGSDLARGSGVGGGGNPMKAGETAGTGAPTRTGGPVGKATTSMGAGPQSPQGGGTDTRKP